MNFACKFANKHVVVLTRTQKPSHCPSRLAFVTSRSHFALVYRKSAICLSYFDESLIVAVFQYYVLFIRVVRPYSNKTRDVCANVMKI